MTVRCLAVLFCSVLLVALLLGAGCTSTTIGDISYHNNNLIIPVTCTGGPQDAYVQVTVYEIQGLHQQELTYLQEPVLLQKGANEVIVPADLSPGTYKLYIYVLRTGERETATIRDLVV